MKKRVILIGFVLLLATSALGGAAGTALDLSAAPAVGTPGMVSYQGQVQVDGELYDGTGYFKFAIVDGSGSSTWSNDGTSIGGSPPAASVPLPVSDGLFSVLLGGAGMPPLTAAAFADDETYLHAWFSSDGTTFSELVPATPIAAVPYALAVDWSGIAGVPADLADGDDDTTYTEGIGIQITGDVISAAGSPYAEVVVVAKGGGDYSSIQAAIDAVKGDASLEEPYLVWVAPGTYEGEVIMAPYVHLQGAGRGATLLSSATSAGTIPPTVATLILASNSSVRDLTVLHNGSGYANVAIMAPDGTTESLLEDVSAQSKGNSENTIGVSLTGSSTEVHLENVTALGEYGASWNYGLHLFSKATAIVHGGSFTARGGSHTRGILNHGSTLDAADALVLGEDASDQNYGLDLTGASARLHGGSLTALGGLEARGINVNNGTLDAEGARVLGESSVDASYGLYNYRGTVTLVGGTVTARGATATTCGINNEADGLAATLVAHEVIVLGDSGGDSTYGFRNHGGAEATLYGGSFEAHGGTWCLAILNRDAGSSLEALEIRAQADGGNSVDGLRNEYGAATLHGGTYIARGGNNCTGIASRESGATLDARNVTGLGESCSNSNFGLMTGYEGSAVVLGGEFTGRGGVSFAAGLEAWGGGTLQAHGVTARGLDNTNESSGLIIGSTDVVTVADSVLEGTDNWLRSGSSSVDVIHSHLIGPDWSGGITASCVAVTWDGKFYESSCPPGGTP